jgi:hypothetical protein
VARTRAPQVGDGVTDFSPSPQESRAIVRAGYACAATLLVRFADDGIDETPEMQQILAERALRGGEVPAVAARGSSGSSEGGSSEGGSSAGGGGMGARAADDTTTAWSSVDEDVSFDALLARLAALQASVARQGAPAAGAGQGGGGGGGQQQQQQAAVQSLVLPGSHITPCGASSAQLGLLGAVSLGPGPLDVLLDASSSPRNLGEQRALLDSVLAFLDAQRRAAPSRRTAARQAQAQAQAVAPQAAAAPRAAAAAPAAAAEAEREVAA